MTTQSRTKIVVLFGGRSAEHEISLLSARNVVRALDRARFEPILVGIGKDGRWRREREATLEAAVGDPRSARLDPGAPVVAFEDVLNPDVVVFPVLHGTYGEDGTLQGLLDFMDVGYVGPGVLGSAVGMDKDIAKRLLRDAGLPIVDYELVTAGSLADDPDAPARAAARLGFPLFVKPANAGSSVGVSRVLGPDRLGPALDEALRFDRKVLLERGVPGAREIECAVLGNDRPQASAPGEVIITHQDGFYSYQAKYVDATGAAIRIPAELPDPVQARVRELAVAAFRALELSGMARIDFFLERDSQGGIYINEVNTIPGFTAISMYPKMWEAAGLATPDLVTRLIELAVDRRDLRRALLARIIAPTV